MSAKSGNKRTQSSRRRNRRPVSDTAGPERTKASEADTLALVRFSHHLSAVLLAAGTILSMFAMVSSLPLFRFGGWGDVAPNHVVLFCSASIIFAGLSLGRRLRFDWISLIALALVFWSVVVSWLAEDRILSFFGSPVTAEGTALLIALWAWIMAGRSIMLARDWRLATVIGLLTIALLIFAAAVNHQPAGFPWKLYHFPDQLGLFALFLPLLLARFAINKGGKTEWAVIGSSFVLAIFLGWLSDNRAAFLLIAFVSLPLWFLGSLLVRKYSTPSAAIRLFLIIPSLGLVGVATVFIQWVGNNYDVSTMGDWTEFYSLWSRRMHFLMLEQELFANLPQALMTGVGFGASLISIKKYFLEAGQNMTDLTWDAVSRGMVNSHSIYYEYLLSAGLPGLVLVLSLMVAPVWFCRWRYLPIVSAVLLPYSLMMGLWFQLSTLVPFFALAAGFGSGHSRFVATGLNGKFLRLVMIVAAGIMAFTAWNIWSVNRHYDRDIYLASDRNCVISPGMDGSHAILTRSLNKAIHPFLRQDSLQKAGDPQIIADQVAWLDCLAWIVEAKLQNSPAPSTALDYLLYASGISWGVTDIPNLPELQKRANYHAGLSISLLSDFGINRPDLTLPWFTWAVAQAPGSSGHEKAKQLAAALHNKYPEQPVYSWFLGQFLLKEKANELRLLGFDMILLALQEQDLRSFISVPENMEMDLRASRKLLLQAMGSEE